MKQVQLAYSAKDWKTLLEETLQNKWGQISSTKILIARAYHFSNIPEPSFGVWMRTASPQLFWCYHLNIVLCIADS